MKSAEEFKKVLAAVRHKAWITYYTGFMFADRQKDPAVDELGKEAYKALKDGRVLLVQRRVRPNIYDYIAVKR